jgi:hypothetical protein
MRSVGEAIWSRLLHNEACPSWASGELRARSLLEEALGRGVNSPALLFPPEAGLGRGEITSLEYTKPWPKLRPSVSAACADGDYQPCLGVLGVPLITVPDSSPRASKGVLVLAWRLCRTFFARGPALLGYTLFRWVRASASAGCSPRGLGGVV